ncbi:MAG: hypothetical protein NUW01_19845, partial [Gemmatimonadaceae bacterium]|nr:hypothetical protein [Gemmatimonadaceae bacterium]
SDTPWWGSGGGMPPNPLGGQGEFSDPWGQQNEQLTSDYIASLLAPANTGPLQEYMDMLKEQQGQARARAQTYADTLNTRIDELNQTPYTAGDEAVMRAKAFDSLERRRQQTLRAARENVYARGFEPTSGIAREYAEQPGQSQVADVNRLFEESRTGIESGLLESSIAEGQRRKNLATTLQGLVRQALNGGDMTALDEQYRIVQMQDFIDQQSLGRKKEAVSATTGPLDLIMDRAGLANQTLSGSADPLSAIMQLLQVGGNQAYSQNALNQNNSAGLGQLLALLLSGM